MRQILTFALTLTLSTAAFAQDATCMATATQKKLSGAAKTSFMKKCEKDALASCASTANEKKLSGAARQSYESKCMADAVGTAAPAAAASGAGGSPMR